MTGKPPIKTYKVDDCSLSVWENDKKTRKEKHTNT